MQDATLCFLIKGDPPGEVLLGWKKVGFGADKYNGFGGKVEAGETIPEATVRELAEETGVRVDEADLLRVAHLTFLFPAQPAWDQVVHVFVATVWDGEPVEGVEMKPLWFPVEEIPYAEMWQDDPHWLPQVLAGQRVRARFTFAEDNEQIETLTVESLELL